MNDGNTIYQQHQKGFGFEGFTYDRLICLKGFFVIELYVYIYIKAVGNSKCLKNLFKDK